MRAAATASSDRGGAAGDGAPVAGRGAATAGGSARAGSGAGGTAATTGVAAAPTGARRERASAEVTARPATTTPASKANRPRRMIDVVVCTTGSSAVARTADVRRVGYVRTR